MLRYSLAVLVSPSSVAFAPGSLEFASAASATVGLGSSAAPVVVVAVNAALGELDLVDDLTSLPIPHGTAFPSGWIAFGAAVTAPVAEAIVNRDVHCGFRPSWVNSAS